MRIAPTARFASHWCRGLVIAATLLGLSLRAQDWWSVVPQDITHQNLWSIAYGNRTLVAVGEQGTILSYTYDDVVWFPRDSGTGVWLVGTGFGAGRFVIVGDRGTILTSDDNGATWTPRTSGTTTRLNAAAYGNGRWLVVGEQGIVLTSTDGTTWTQRPALGSGFLRALAFGQGQFLVGGAGGALFSTTDGVTFAPVPIATTANIEGAAISPNHFWIVGSAGLRASATQLGSWTFGVARAEIFRGVTVRNLDEASAVGESASETFLLNGAGFGGGDFLGLKFLATAVVQGENEVVAVGFAGNVAHARMNAPAFIVSDLPAIYGRDVHFNVITGSAATSFQWTRNNVDIPGATQPTLVISSVTPATAGGIGVRWATSVGQSTLGGGAVFPVHPAGRPEVRDLNFAPALPNLPALVVPQPDGKLLVAGSFSVTVNGGATYGLARLNTDGSLDLNFRAGAGVTSTTSVNGIQVLADGRIYVRGSFSSIGGQSRAGLARLLANGSADSSFNPDVTLGFPTNTALAPDGRLYVQINSGSSATLARLAVDGSRDATFAALNGHQLVGVDTQGRVLALKFPASTFATTPDLVRCLANGSPDGSYTPAKVTIFHGVDGGQDDMFSTVLTDAGLYTAVSFYSRLFSTISFVRYKPDGGRDSAYQSPPPLQYPQAPGTFAYRPDGSLWIVRATDNSGAFRAEGYTVAGTADATRYATTPGLSSYSIRAFSPDGSLLVTGLNNNTAFDTLFRIRPITGRVGRLTNLSVRAFVASANEPLIAGFVTSGADTTRAIVRGVGPALTQFGVSDAMTDPRLTLTRDGVTAATNDDWLAALAPRFTSVGAFPLTAGSRDAALESSVTAGNYTAVITPAPGDSGTSLVELYESTDTPPAPRRFINVSARGPVASSRPLIVGFSVTGDVPVTVLVRSAGPALTQFGVTGALADPQLALFRADIRLWENDNWAPNNTDFRPLTDAGARTGAFAFTPNSNDAAMLVTLAPGSYTAVVSGANNSSGVALVEVYEVP